MVDVGFIDRVRGGIGVHDVLKGGVIKGEGLTGFSVVQIRVSRGLWRGWIIYSPFWWRGGSGGGIVLFELLDGHINQEFVDVGRKEDEARGPSGVGSVSRRGRRRLPRNNGGDRRRPIEVGSVDLVDFLSWHVNDTIGGT